MIKTLKEKLYRLAAWLIVKLAEFKNIDLDQLDHHG